MPVGRQKPNFWFAAGCPVKYERTSATNLFSPADESHCPARRAPARRREHSMHLAASMAARPRPLGAYIEPVRQFAHTPSFGLGATHLRWSPSTCYMRSGGHAMLKHSQKSVPSCKYLSSHCTLTLEISAWRLLKPYVSCS